LKILVLSLGLLAGLGTLLAVGAYRWRARTANLLDRLRQRGMTARASTFTVAELRGLPPPVVRYLGTVLSDAQPVVRYARLTQRGQFLVRPTPTGWRPFVATEHFATHPGGFIWDARIHLGLGLSIWVRDAFIEGTGSMLGRLMGLWRVVAVQNTPEIAAAALLRYLAEAVWFPTTLLPSQGVVWSALDDASARATLTVAATTVSLDFHFGADGLVTRVFTAARARDVQGRAVPTPWQGRFSRYEVRRGLRIPMVGEVEWLLPEGPQLYWRGELTAVAYEYEGGAERTPS
jgi:hypothetical protein